MLLVLFLLLLRPTSLRAVAVPLVRCQKKPWMVCTQNGSEASLAMQQEQQVVGGNPRSSPRPLSRIKRSKKKAQAKRKVEPSQKVAISCVHPTTRSYLRLAKHETLKFVAKADGSAGKVESWEIVPGSEDSVRFRSSTTGDFLAMSRSGPAWTLSATSSELKNESLFHIERSTQNSTLRLYSSHARVYVNCLISGDVVGGELGSALEILSETDSSFSVDCQRTCRGDPAASTGYGHVTHPSIDFVCPSSFRDLADWVFAWPFSHFKEQVWVAPTPTAVRCMAKVPVIYAHSNSLTKIEEFVRQKLKRPFVLVSGQSDFPVSRSKALLSVPFLVGWYAQNADVKHPKLKPLPIGLNCFEHGAAMRAAIARNRRNFPPTTAVSKPLLLWVNFGYTHPRRKVAWTHFCGGGEDGEQKKGSFSWRQRATCVKKSHQNQVGSESSNNNTKNNRYLVDYYGRISRHKFVAAPRGNGIDTHRVWEALYLGCVPIVEKSALDSLYREAGVLVVDSWTSVTPDFLESVYPHHAATMVNASRLLTTSYWREQFERERKRSGAGPAALATLNDNRSSRARCWGRRTRMSPSVSNTN